MQLPKNKASQLRHIKREPERVGAQYTLDELYLYYHHWWLTSNLYTAQSQKDLR